MSHWVEGIQTISTTSLPSSDACVAKGQKPTVMSGFNTSYCAEGAGKVVFKHCQRVIYLPKRYVEQMSDRVKSLGGILQLLSSLWCFSEAVLPVFIHLLLWVTAEQLPPPKKRKNTVTPPNQINQSLPVLLFYLYPLFLPLLVSAKKIKLQTLKVMTLPQFHPSLFSHHLPSSIQKNWQYGWKMVVASQSTNQLIMKDYKLLLMPNAWRRMHSEKR